MRDRRRRNEQARMAAHALEVKRLALTMIEAYIGDDSAPAIAAIEASDSLSVAQTANYLAAMVAEFATREPLDPDQLRAAARSFLTLDED